MGRKLPPYFLKADTDAPCQGCDKVRSTCRYCERCYDCCECSPRFICPYCHGYDITVQAGSDMARDLHPCQCEPCAGNCGKTIQDPDEGNYLEGNYEPYCDRCYARENK
jgi:hypothetical protein